MISVPNGHFSRSAAMILSTSRLMAMIFSPVRFLIARLTASRPFSREMLLSSLKPSITLATSFR
ncbi:MAG: hypothetical protein ACD_75C00343G0004 [uncultured bacterium]|nr:MAG: hypothetical protein ACD_75C00343G0004 [uncultured bacterium]